MNTTKNAHMIRKHRIIWNRTYHHLNRFTRYHYKDPLGDLLMGKYANWRCMQNRAQLTLRANLHFAMRHMKRFKIVVDVRQKPAPLAGSGGAEVP